MLLRHAWAGERTPDPDTDRLRPLDGFGRDQAARLPRHLAGALGTNGSGCRLVSSPLTRCVATLEPLRAAWDLDIATDERLAEQTVPLRAGDLGAEAAWYGARGLQAVTATAARGPAGGTLIVCSHGEILPGLLAAVVGHVGIEVPDAIDLSAKAMPKAGAWIIRLDRGEVTEIGPPPTPQPSGS